MRSHQHWNLYWESGAQGSFEFDAEDASGTGASALWEGFFRELPDDARHLDVGCGNGGVSLIAARTARTLRRRFELHAVDLACVHPAKSPAGRLLVDANVRFQGGVDMAALPFEDHSFDAVTGQYALEYADTDRATAEILRVLAPGGRARFVLHHAHSLVVNRARDEMHHLDWLLTQSGLFDAASSLLERIADATSTTAIAALQSDTLAEALRLRFNAICHEVSARIASGEAVGGLRRVLGQLSEIIKARARLGSAQACALVDETRLQMTAHRARLDDLLAAACDEACIYTLSKRLAILGAHNIDFDLLHHLTGALFGWRLDFRS